MLQFTKGDTAQIIVSLKEMETLINPNYLFYFKHRGLNTTVSFVLLNAADTSLYKDRYSQFDITVNTYFLNEYSGEWEYYIYEQASTTNINPLNATSLLESGLMRLNKSSEFSFTEYAPVNTFITR